MSDRPERDSRSIFPDLDEPVRRVPRHDTPVAGAIEHIGSNGRGVIETPPAPPAAAPEPAPPAPPSAPPPQPPADPLQVIAVNEENPDAVRILAMRLGRAERQIPEIMQLAQGVTTLFANQEHLQKLVGALSSQQAMVELQMERHVRGVALDLALKAATGKDEPVVDADLVTRLAESFLAWLRGGPQA